MLARKCLFSPSRNSADCHEGNTLIWHTVFQPAYMLLINWRFVYSGQGELKSSILRLNLCTPCLTHHLQWKESPVQLRNTVAKSACFQTYSSYVKSNEGIPFKVFAATIVFSKETSACAMDFFLSLPFMCVYRCDRLIFDLLFEALLVLSLGSSTRIPWASANQTSPNAPEPTIFKKLSLSLGNSQSGS